MNTYNLIDILEYSCSHYKQFTKKCEYLRRLHSTRLDIFGKHGIIELYFNMDFSRLSTMSEGKLECLKYAYKHDCRIQFETCYRASLGGHIECLQRCT